MKSSKIVMLFSAVLLTTLLSIYFTANAESYASKSTKDVYTYADSTHGNNDCCKDMNNCSGMDNSSMHNHMDMGNSSMHNNMDMDKDNSDMEMNSGEHQHQHNDNNNDSKDDNSSGCMGH
jgi:hypothetical protein